jgi:CBS domain-containing protein
MRVQDIMTPRVQTIEPSATAGEAWELMRENGIHHLVVVRGGDVIGVLSDRDAGGRLGVKVRTGRTVADLMTNRVIEVEPTTTVRRAANLMRGRSIGCLVVTDRSRIKGIVTVSDLLELIGRGVERPVADTRRRTLHHRAPHRKRNVAYGVW